MLKQRNIYYAVIIIKTSAHLMPIKNNIKCNGKAASYIKKYLTLKVTYLCALLCAIAI